MTENQPKSDQSDIKTELVLQTLKVGLGNPLTQAGTG